MIVVFTGGTGGSKLVHGLQEVVAGNELTVVVNTGDDVEWWGLHVSPDIDSVLYELSGQLDFERGWGVENETFRCRQRMKRFGQPSWFSLGDLDLATHLTRTILLREGKSLSEATAELAAKLGVQARVLPMSDDRVSTMLETARGTLTFQEYFVRERYQVDVQAVRFEGAEDAQPAPGVLGAIESADAIIFAPSNPVTSLGPILAVPGIRAVLRRSSTPIAAVSPIVGGAAVSGPTGALMQVMGWPTSLAGIAKAYEDFLNVLIADVSDEDEAQHLNGDRLHVVCTNTLMRSLADKRDLARFTLDSLATLLSPKA